MKTIVKKLLFLNRAIAGIRADMPLNPLAGLTDRQRDLIQKYRKATTPEQCWLNHLNNTPTPESLIQSAGLSADCSEDESQQLFHRELESFNKLYTHRKRKALE